MRLPASLSKERLVLAAFVGLLIAAAVLRFYDLTGGSIWYDEAVASDNASRSFTEMVEDTRNRNSSPILYPMALWVVQKVNVSAFSVRLLPAMASVLTVAAMLFLLPRLGIPRGAAFLAALPAALSVAAIYHAQDAREYSIDALLALLMIAGLLWYLRDGRKALLCLTLFLAPLLQYGLVLFGVAVIGTAVILPAPVEGEPERGSLLSRVREWLKARAGLVWPAGCFLAACAISFFVTFRYQTREGGWGWRGYYEYYYQGAYDAASLLEFAASGVRSVLNYHLPAAVAILAVGALALMLAASLKRRRLNAIATLALLALGVAIYAATVTLYPLGGIRQNLYLGPVIFLAAGVAVYWMIGWMASFTGRGWVAPALVVVAAAIALAGVGDLRGDSPYEKSYNAKEVLAYLEENVEEGDLVYIAEPATPSMNFHQDEKPAAYHYGDLACWDALEDCLRDMERLALSLPNAPNRIFVVHEGESAHVRGSMPEAFESLGGGIPVDRVIADGEFRISLIVNAKAFVETAQEAAHSAYDAVASGEPALRSDFDVYLRERTLTYVKEPCAPADTEAKFFLAVYPVDVDDLPGHRRANGFDNRDFRFDRRGVIFAGRCVTTTAPLPDYDIARVKTGQYVRVDDGYRHLWEAEFPWQEGE